jgi:hypothetical protein
MDNRLSPAALGRIEKLREAAIKSRQDSQRASRKYQKIERGGGFKFLGKLAAVPIKGMYRTFSRKKK